MINVAINGFGRIGRVTLRQLLKNDVFNVVAINDLNDSKMSAHLIEFDSVYRGIGETVNCDESSITIGSHRINYTQIRNPLEAKWKAFKVDLVIDCTGIYKTYEAALQHIEAGAKKVLLSYPIDDKKIKSIVLGVNNKELSKDDLVISNASCTTNCAAPILKLIHDKFGIKRGFLSTIHAYTADQNLNDSAHKDFRRSRASATNIIPTSTGAAKALALVIPEIEGKIDGSAYRVPVITGSCIDVVLELEKTFTCEDINKEIKRASENEMRGVVRYTDKEIVSSDIIADAHSSIFDSKLTQESNGLLKIVSWYDNEFGYSNRLVDLCEIL